LLLDQLKGEEPIVANLVGKTKDIEKIVESYAARGFRSYNELVRMTRIQCADDYQILPETAVHIAEREDAARVLAFLERLLDPFAEQIPELEDLVSAADSGQILVAENAKAVEGVLIFQSVGSPVRCGIGLWNQGRATGALEPE